MDYQNVKKFGTEDLVDKKIGIDELLSKSISKVSEWNEWNHDEQETYHIDHTPNSRLLCHLLKMASKEITLPDLETNMILDEIDSESSQKRGSDKGTEKFTSPNKRKRMKKDPIKKNHGMDIRNCMAGKSSVQKQVIEILSDDENEIVENVAEQISFTNSKVLKPKIEQKQDAIASIYMDESSTFGSFDKFIPSVNVSKTWSCERNLPKLETFFEKITIQILKSITFSGAIVKKEIEPKISVSSPKRISPSDYVEVDDLFDTESDHDDNLTANCLNTAISEFHDTDDMFNIGNVQTQLKTENYIMKSKDVDEDMALFNGIDSKILNQSYQIGTTFNETNDMFSSINTPFCESKAVKQPENNNKEFENKFQNVKKDLSTKETNTSLSNLKTSIIASTPIPSVKTFKKNQMIVKSSSQPKIMEDIPEECKSPVSDTSEMWNLSDLFEEEEINIDFQKKSKLPENECNNGSNRDRNSICDEADVHNSTMLGITQLVSLIEKDKDQQKSNDAESKICNNQESNLNSQKQNDDTLFGYLECDVDIFTQVNDQPTSLKHSSQVLKDLIPKPSEKSFTQLNNPSQNIESCKSLHRNETKPDKKTEKLNNIEDETNINNSTQMSQSRPVVNFKKFSSKKLLFSKDINSESACSQNASSSPSMNKLRFETFSQKPSTSTKLKHEEPIKFRTLSETWNTPNLLKNNVNFNKPTSSVAKKKLLWDDKMTGEIKKPETVTDQMIADRTKVPEKAKLNNIKSSEINRGIEKSVFESKPNFGSLNKPIWNFSDSDDSDIFMPLSPKENKSNIEIKKNITRKEEFCSIKKTKTRKKVSNEFIEREADVEGTIISDDDSDGSSLDDVDNSFINDNTEYISNDTQAIYLKSVKSPINKGNFKIPTNKVYYGNVYSQQVEADSEYINDSFCVDSEEEEAEESARSLSLLEIAEQKLENRKNEIPVKKRRRILNVPEDDYTQPTFITMSEPSPIRSLAKRKRRRIQSESEAEESPIRKKKSLSEANRSVDPELVFSQKHEQGRAERNLRDVNLSSDEDDCIFVPTQDKVVDLTSDIDEKDLDSEFDKKFQEDLNEAIRRSQADFASSQRSQNSSKMSTPKAEKKVLDMKKLDKSLRELNQKFSERLSNIRNKFCSSDDSL
ncbi:unnamed protein product [Nezara viridula]|uniref:Uncharacterized protein n=1 Tax=Nezara viridula TaxID=85310 RepID=A0A9P0MSI2_NEZVI|nr:unnamed protein product [Nezara viridula]